MTPVPSLSTCLHTAASCRRDRNLMLNFAAGAVRVEAWQRSWALAGKWNRERRAWERRAEAARAAEARRA